MIAVLMFWFYLLTGMLQPADWNAAAQACHEDGFLILIWKS
jgi:hypothetical protein